MVVPDSGSKTLMTPWFQSVDVKATYRILPPGRNCGQRWLVSASSSWVNSTGSPPAAETWDSPLFGVGAKTIVFSSPHVAPRLRLTLQSFSGAPPEIETFFNSVGVMKAIQLPSGEKIGL